MPRPAASRTGVRDRGGGTAYVYVAPCHGEQILKLGFSREPLERLQSLHARWFEFFDLDRGWLIETDSVREARELELQLRTGLGPHNAPSPLPVVVAPGAHTEWFRGALPALRRQTDALAALGQLVHEPLREWLRPRLAAQADRLYHWSEALLQAIDEARHLGAAAAPRARLERRLLDALDAHAAFGFDVDARLPGAVAEWHRAARDHGLRGRG
jgi:hypothetical protein